MDCVGLIALDGVGRSVGMEWATVGGDGADRDRPPQVDRLGID